jgi:hypothetical protein
MTNMTSTFSASLEHWPLDGLIPHAYVAAGVPLGQYDGAVGWRIIEGMRGGCYCDVSLADRIVARHPC